MLAGANIIYGAGMLELGMTFSYSQYVADDEIVRMLSRILRGIPSDDEHLAVDIIKEVGTLKNAPVYQLMRSGLPPRAKLGLPHLYSVNKSGIFELSLDDVVKVIAMESFKSGGKRLQ